jgi:hypothetical protein
VCAHSDIEKIEGLLREILKKINKFVIDTLKVNAKEDIIQRYLVKITKQQSGNSLITDKINYYLKTYEKDLFVIQADSFAKEVSKYTPSHTGIAPLGSALWKRTTSARCASCRSRLMNQFP